MKFDIITIFPRMFDSYFAESILARAQKNKLIDISVHNLREYADDKHRTVDDTSYGGGPGMIMKVEPIAKCVAAIKSQKNSKTGESKLKSRVILFSAKGKKYTQKDARRLVKYEKLILICGRYEGVDERVAMHIADEELSIGEYVLTGGELPAMIVADSIARLIPGVLGNAESLTEESFTSVKNSVLEYPQFTKPENFNGWSVPDVLLNGHHKKIEEWRVKHKNKKIEKK